MGGDRKTFHKVYRMEKGMEVYVCVCVCVSHLRVNKPLGMAGIKSDEGKKKSDEAKICMCSFTQQIMS